MMKAVTVLVCTSLIAGAGWLVIEFSPLFLRSRIERLVEKDLPKIVVEKGGVVYCRMKADDFRFPLPPGSHALNPAITSGGFASGLGFQTHPMMELYFNGQALPLSCGPNQTENAVRIAAVVEPGNRARGSKIGRFTY